jgi:hypothetical protein
VIINDHKKSMKNQFALDGAANGLRCGGDGHRQRCTIHDGDRAFLLVPRKAIFSMVMVMVHREGTAHREPFIERMTMT